MLLSIVHELGTVDSDEVARSMHQSRRECDVKYNILKLVPVRSQKV